MRTSISRIGVLVLWTEVSPVGRVGFRDSARRPIQLPVPRARPHLHFPLAKVLARIDSLVMENFQEGVEAARHKTPEEGANPVDPVVTRKVSVDHIRSERAGWINGAAGVVCP